MARLPNILRFFSFEGRKRRIKLNTSPLFHEINLILMRKLLQLNHNAVYCKTQFQRKLRERQTSFDEHNRGRSSFDLHGGHSQRARQVSEFSKAVLPEVPRPRFYLVDEF